MSGMRVYGLLSIIGGVVLFGIGVNMIVSAYQANLLEISLALILGVGGTVVFASGGVILAVSRSHQASEPRPSSLPASTPLAPPTPFPWMEDKRQ